MSKKIEQIIEKSIYNKNKNTFVYQKLTNLTTCTRCRGAGIIVVDVSTGETKDCPKCHGSGVQD